MIKRTLYFGSNSYVHTRREQLIVEFRAEGSAASDSMPARQAAKVPIEDIGVVIFDAPQMTVSRAVLSKLLENNVAVIVCNEKHLPKGLLLNLDANNIQQELFRNQIKAKKALLKNLWQQTVKAKILNQSLLLEGIGKSGKKLKYWSEHVQSGDPSNVEGRAAAHYWKQVFADVIKKFRRQRFGAAPNNLLNYGYAILRAVVARNLAASGLLPTFGIHHRNKYNAYALADDIMEPYRPYVDSVVFDVVEKYYDESWVEKGFELSPEIKKELLLIPQFDVSINGQTRPLMIAVRETTASLSDCFAKTKRKISYPKFLF